LYAKLLRLTIERIFVTETRPLRYKKQESRLKCLSTKDEIPA